MERTVILLREKRGVSVREQRIACNAYANEHGIKVVKEYVSTGNEPIDFQTRLRQDPLTDIVKGLIRSKIDSVLVYQSSYIGREEMETKIAIDWFEEYSHKLHSATGV